MNEAATTIPSRLAGKIVKPARSRNQSDCRIWRIPPACKLRKKIYLSCRRTYYLQERPTVLFIGALSSRADVHGQVSSRRTLLGPGTSLRLMQRFPPCRESKQITELKQQGRFRAVFILQMCVVFFQRDIFSLCLTIFRRNRSSD